MLDVWAACKKGTQKWTEIKEDGKPVVVQFECSAQDLLDLNNTILENIRIGKKDATDEEVIQAARLANCEEFALKLPDGYNSMIGENGCELPAARDNAFLLPALFSKTPRLSYWMKRPQP